MQVKTLIMITLIGLSVLGYLVLIINAMRFAKKCECKGECTCGEERQIIRKTALVETQSGSM
jgi:hypothetical protein